MLQVFTHGENGTAHSLPDWEHSPKGAGNRGGGGGQVTLYSASKRSLTSLLLLWVLAILEEATTIPSSYLRSRPQREGGFAAVGVMGENGKKGIGGQSLPEKWRRGSQAKKGEEEGERHPHTLMTGKGGGAGFNGRIAKKWSWSAFSNLNLYGSIGRLVFMSLFYP